MSRCSFCELLYESYGNEIIVKMEKDNLNRYFLKFSFEQIAPFDAIEERLEIDYCPTCGRNLTPAPRIISGK